MLTSGERPPIVTTDKELDIPMKHGMYLKLKITPFTRNGQTMMSPFFLTINRSEINKERDLDSIILYIL